MRRQLVTHALCAVLAAVLATTTTAQMQEEVDSPAQTDLARERKTPSVFHRPARQTPAEQLIYAQELEAGGRLRKAAGQYNALVHQWHESREAVDAQMSYARLLEQRGRYRRAFDEYQYLIENYAGLFPYDTVLDRQFRLANLVAATRHFDFLFMPGFAAPELALPLLEQLVSNAPRWPRAAEVQLRIGVLHEEDGDEDAAVKAYQTTIERYGDSPYAADAAYRLAVCLRSIALTRPHNEAGLQRAAGAFAEFIMAHPDHPAVDEAKLRMEEMRARMAELAFARALYYDQTLKRPESAVLAYQDFLMKFPAAKQSADAKRRIDELKKELEHHVAEK